MTAHSRRREKDTAGPPDAAGQRRRPATQGRGGRPQLVTAPSPRRTVSRKQLWRGQDERSPGTGAERARRQPLGTGWGRSLGSHRHSGQTTFPGLLLGETATLVRTPAYLDVPGQGPLQQGQPPSAHGAPGALGRKQHRVPRPSPAAYVPTLSGQACLWHCPDSPAEDRQTQCERRLFKLTRRAERMPGSRWEGSQLPSPAAPSLESAPGF